MIGDNTIAESIPYKVLITVVSLTLIAVIALLSGADAIAHIAVGAVVGYLGKLNGYKGNKEGG